MNVLFDLDGTLTDPRPGIVGCMEYALAKLDRDPTEYQNLERFIGPPLIDSFFELLGNADEAHTAVGYYRERFSVTGLYENAVYDGIEQCLSELATAGHRMLVATSKPSVFADRIIDHFHLRQHFTQVYGSELDGRHTDKSQLIAYLLQQEQLDSADTVMIGDRSHDIVGARANKVRSVGVLWGYGSQDELSSAGANLLCHSPELLFDCITSADKIVHSAREMD